MNNRALSFDIVKKRRDDGLSLRVASRESYINWRTLSKLEHGRTPTVMILERVCKWLGTKPGDYFP